MKAEDALQLANAYTRKTFAGSGAQKGEKGDPGKDGKSAYQIWIDAGNVGDEAAFLESIKGKPGKDGAPGSKGDKGDKGDTGATGAAGKNGSDASVTKENIETVLGYTPADEKKVSQLSEEVVDQTSLAKHLTIVHAPSPQLPANAESGSDFNLHTFADFGAGYHSYFDDLVARYPHYLTREFLGNDSSETLPMYRYTLGNHYWNAWYKENYPRMYAWKNDNKVIYSKSVSPRIGDVMYEQGYIGATYGGGQPATTYIKPKAVIIRKKRYSLSSGAFKDFVDGSAVIFPLFAEGITDNITVEMTNMQVGSAYKYVYAGATNEKFETSLSESLTSGSQSFTVDAPSGGFTESHNYATFVVIDHDGWAGTLDPATATLTVNGIEMELIISTDVADASLASPSKTEQSGTSEGYPITDVSATNRSRTVNGLEFVRYPDGDVEPTLLYTELVNTKNVTYGYTYDANWERQDNIAEYGDGVMISGGATYIRYPYGDLRKDKTKPIHMTIIANEHGGDSEPAIPAVVTARLIRDLCQGRHSDNPVMSFLRDSVQLTIIPVVNPHGLNRYAIGEYNGYQNANGININRNYDTVGWDVTKALGAEIDTTDACGDYAGSENETQYVMNTMVDSEAVVAMSVHTISCHVTNHERCNYQGQNPNGAYTQDKIEDMRIDMKTSYNLNFLPYDPLECPPDTTSKSPSFITQCGAYGGIVEFQCHDPLATDEEISTDESMFTDVVMEQNYSLLLKFIAMWLSDYLESK